MTYKQLVKSAATVRNQTVTYAGVTPLKLAFGIRPADLIQLDVAAPTQLTIDRNEEELTAIQIKQLSKQASSGEAQGILLAGRYIQDGIRKDALRENLELIFSYQKRENPCRKNKTAPQPIQRRNSYPHQLLRQNPQCYCVTRVIQLPSHLIRQSTCSSRTSHPFLNKHIGFV